MLATTDHDYQTLGPKRSPSLVLAKLDHRKQTMNQQPALADIVQIAEGLRPNYDVQVSFNPLAVRIVELDGQHGPVELHYQDAHQFYTHFTRLAAEHDSSLDHVEAMLYLAKPYIDAVMTNPTSESLREENDDGERRLTNTEFVSDLMDFSKFGVLAQVFVIDVLRKSADQMANLSQEELLAAMEGHAISPAAWQGVAIEIRDKFKAQYGD